MLSSFSLTSSILHFLYRLQINIMILFDIDIMVYNNYIDCISFDVFKLNFLPFVYELRMRSTYMILKCIYNILKHLFTQFKKYLNMFLDPYYFRRVIVFIVTFFLNSENSMLSICIICVLQIVVEF